MTAVPAGGQALTLARTGDYALLILDLGLADMDRSDVLRRLREGGDHIPVLILTARSSVTDTVAGLELGSDDHMAKLFRFEDLLARVRQRQRPSAGEDTSLVDGALKVDLRRRRTRVGNREVDLSAPELALAEKFLRHPGQTLSREQLRSQVWGYDLAPGSDVVDVYVRYLRKKLGAEHFHTVRGVGYRLVDATAQSVTSGS